MVIDLITPRLQLHLQLTYDETYKHVHIHMMTYVQCMINWTHAHTYYVGFKRVGNLGLT